MHGPRSRAVVPHLDPVIRRSTISANPPSASAIRHDDLVARTQISLPSPLKLAVSCVVPQGCAPLRQWSRSILALHTARGPIRNLRMSDRAVDSTTARLFFARRGPYTFPCRRCGGACLSAGAGHADDIEEVAHHAKIVSLAPCSAASTRLARGRCCRCDDFIGLARLCDRVREHRRR
jgi:hypothetical protein